MPALKKNSAAGEANEGRFGGDFLFGKRRNEEAEFRGAFLSAARGKAAVFVFSRGAAAGEEIWLSGNSAQGNEAALAKF